MVRIAVTKSAAALLFSLLAASGEAAQSSGDALPSWNAGATKTAITQFVTRVTREDGPDFVPPAQRIAAFDNDGTLWVEQPFYFQLAFAFDRVRAMATQHPEWQTKQPFKGLLEFDMDAVAAVGKNGLLEVIAATHAGMSTEQFEAIVRDWITEARHPRFARRYAELVYQPMLELLGYLRANGFKTYIVSGGGVEFMRPWTEAVYGIPPEHVIGSSGVTQFRLDAEGRPELAKVGKVEFINDGPGKPVGINRFIGRRPILAFGNSDGDLQMLQWTAAGEGARLAALVHHTDAAREFAYDRRSRVGKLDKALDEAVARNWLIVDMKRDWRSVFPFERQPSTVGSSP